MDSRISKRFTVLIGGLALLVVCGAVQASGARQGVKARPGEIVLLRDVPARAAYRMQPPGQALIADPSPRRELAASLGTSGMDELSDADYASMESGLADNGLNGHGVTTVERVTSGVVSGTLGRAVGDGGALSGGQLARTIGGPMGAVNGATRGIGDQVRGALAQFPLGQPPGGAGGK
ncbi:hypothetical protein [Stenotrophomonas sp. SY1]|uniref:hypothetical protein n=1 Tax=Stenotrophomonas sp. SY1 TaxID=477235 RepID=UPI001E2BAB39|nr:hypothetical protein [Stenotrophomonas sp. SY1]MCD9086535.1 hypothetical protein [Stenotrophomonas sp. SY1]